MLAKMDPFRDLRTIEDEFDRLMGRALSRDAWMPALDVRETEDRYEVHIDLPGLDPSDVNVTFEDGMLTISGKRQFDQDVLAVMVPKTEQAKPRTIEVRAT